ncbi:bifunctional MaoC family dehydratase N-terminal/OB-fold nucleic acid binding domain-containing protein [Spirillospora albida]|uniref:bifunctional MaoC family dehydratase N-terminal/OB-fold nucleic acid binding domain-containing protein n=1 Tax=Spirillospora albida TaxID=58123 RepID=UPI0004BFB89E|nr:bifunctional MaoC family dehydratase N-terminal/OB-fold nucleic acid binding domain-containing protein [Spirillospora albida]
MNYEERLQSWVGRRLSEPRRGQDPVNVPMIRHWVEAMEDDNPVFLDEDAARATGRDGVVAPASMMQAWTMRGYKASVNADSAPPTGGDELVALLAEGGYTSVVATDSEFTFERELVPGDHVSVEERVESISPEKTTGLGTGRFISTIRTYRDANGEVVATQKWRTLRFRPAEKPKPKALRPRPAINPDNAFWFEAAKEHRLVIQRCADCKSLRHPPGPCCPQCGSFAWDTVESSGNGHVYSYVVNHHPRHPAFDYPLIVAVIELAEGTRLIANMTGIEPADVRIGMPVALDWIDPDPDLSLPVFRPAGPRSQT